MNIGGIIYESLNDGTGVRTVIFISGCKHNCIGCHNPKLLNFNYGIPFNSKIQNYIIDHMKNDKLIVGLTVSGGDPIYHKEELLPFLKIVKQELPKNDIWLYTGFNYEEIKDYEILDYIDVLVDGEYQEENRDVTLKFYGSSNQRVIDVKESRLRNKTKTINI